jgi:hypothetical protein
LPEEAQTPLQQQRLGAFGVFRQFPSPQMDPPMGADPDLVQLLHTWFAPQ